MSKTLQNCRSLQKGLSQDREENSDPFPKDGTVLAIADRISRARLHGYGGREVDAMIVVVRREGISGSPAVSCHSAPKRAHVPGNGTRFGDASLALHLATTTVSQLSRAARV